MLSHTNPPMSARRRSMVKPPVLRVPPPTDLSPHPLPPPPALPTSQTSRNASLELITEQMGWAPVSYVDDVINAMNDLAYKGISSFEQWLQEYGLDEEEAEKGLAATETLFENNIDKHFDKFELLVLQSIFVVPTNLPIKLPHHEELDFSVTAADEANADIEIEELRKSIASAKCLRQKLKEEQASASERLKSLVRMKTDLESLATLSNALPAQPLPVTIPTLLDNLRETRQLAADVQARSHNVSFQELIMRHEEESEEMQDAIAAAIERRRQKQEEIARTPSRRRRSSVGFQVRTGKEGLECAIEYRDKIGGIGDAADIKSWREFLDKESVDS